MRRQLRMYMRHALALVALMVIGVATCAYILDQQGVRLPLLEPGPMEYTAELRTAQAVTPGQGQTVRVSGVRIGDIAAVEASNGRALVRLEIDPEYADLIRADASALLRPKTGLKDMFLELHPGTRSAPRARPGFTIPIRNTMTGVEEDEILAMLDTDTRAYLRLLLSGVGKGIGRRGDELREIFRRFEPTHRDLARVGKGVAEREQHLRRLVRSLNLLTTEIGEKDEELAQLVSSSAQVFRAVASEDRNVTASVGLLPGALRETRRAVEQVGGLADALGPASVALRPAARELEPAGRALAPFARATTPVVRSELRPFGRQLQPLAADLAPALRDLASGTLKATPGLLPVNHALNMLAYNEGGREAPDKPDRQEGNLFWLAWSGHNAIGTYASADAHGPLRPVGEMGSCSTWLGFMDGLGGGDPLVGIALRGFEGIFTDPRVCKGFLGEQPDGRRKKR